MIDVQDDGYTNYPCLISTNCIDGLKYPIATSKHMELFN